MMLFDQDSTPTRSHIEWSPAYRNVAFGLSQRSFAGESLPNRLRDQLSNCVGEDLSTVRIHADVHAARFTRQLGVSAFAMGEHLYFAPGAYRPHTPAGLRLLGHELAHVIQQRGGVAGADRVDRRRLLDLEWEADAFADAILAGRSMKIQGQADCPPILPAIPLIVWGILAALGASTTTYVVSKTVAADDVAKDAKYSGEHMHEKWWFALIPVVGSVDQVINGRSAGSRAIGACFVVVDLFTAGTVKGIVVALNSVGRKAVGAGLSKVGGNKVAQEATEDLLKIGTQFLTKEEGLKQLSKVLTGNATKPVIIASAESWRNHAVTYILDPISDTIWKIHGGPSSLFFRKESKAMILSETRDQFASKLINKANHLSIYTEPMMQQAGHQLAVNFFQNAMKSPAFVNFLRAPGCGGSQVLLLSKSGIRISGNAGSRLLSPVFPLQVLKSKGSHIILNPRLAKTGTMIQAGVWSALPAAAKLKQLEYIVDEKSQSFNTSWSQKSSATSEPFKNPFGDILFGQSSLGFDLDAYASQPGNLLDLADFAPDDDEPPLAISIEQISQDTFFNKIALGGETSQSEWLTPSIKTLALPPK